ncbi:hypothetical protein [Mesorhizobium retamae]|uniref:Uncharacterized protein n=1 Tax=Mesorhizobium retamae TaxID=2912854 RepID=A0ABS9QK97_9HYPH|nr:hypothetical protein [Mesorhizobium sp. IRAMC:0171]MCG7507044.1 hypothetical protein [Mesorhizobium sp. IRAMC:0171]
MASRKHDDDDWLWSYVDLLGVLSAALLAFVYLMLPLINEPSKAQDNIPPPGNIAVLACWQTGDIDVDLWTDAPGQKAATGYSNKSGAVWSLLRDDLGQENDSGPSNCESAFARATPAGEFVVNLHGYSLPTGPVTVHVEIAINGRLLLSRDIEIKPKQERTVVRFTLGENGQVVSSNEVFKPLRSTVK